MTTSVRLSVVVRLSLVVVLPVFLILQANARNKEKLADDLLKAHTVMILVLPDVRQGPTSQTSAADVQEAMEKALMKWGRFSLVHAQTADLLIVGHMGHVEPPALTSPSADGGSLHRNSGNPPLDPNTPGLARPRDSVQRTTDALRLEEDSFEVYRGGVDHPLDSSPLWQYRAKAALHGPKVAAVEHFRKAIDESEKSQQQKH